MKSLTNDFRAALNYTQEVRDRYLNPFYEEWAGENGHYTYLDDPKYLATQMKQHIDTIVHRANKSITVEEKIEQRYTGNLALEIMSNTTPGREKKGWMVDGESDYLLYAFERGDSLDVYLMDFQQLKDWFWKNDSTFKEYTMRDTINKSRFKIVPIASVLANVFCIRYTCREDGFEQC